MVTTDTYRLCHSALKVYAVVKYFWKFAKVKLAMANSPPLKKLILRMADRGNSIKKQRIRPIKMVTVGMINRSISIRAAETWYCKVVSAVDEEVSIILG